MEYTIGLFGRFKFMRVFRNGKIDKRYFDLYGTVIEVTDKQITIRDNDKYEYPVLLGNIIYFKEADFQK